MKVVRYNVTKPEKYESNGEQKTKWNNIGEMVEFHKEDGSVGRVLKIPAIGLEANIFPWKPREDSEGGYVPKENYGEQNGVEEVKVEDIPF